MKFKPILPDPSDVTSFRKKLQAIVNRMTADYERELRPLIEKMTKEQKEKIKESKEVQLIAIDAVKSYTAYEVSRMFNITKKKVIEDIALGNIPGAHKDTTPGVKDPQYLIPEGAIKGYAEHLGKHIEDPSVMDKFNEALHRLRRKYEDMQHVFKNMAIEEATKVYKDAKEQFRKQFGDKVGIDIVKIMAEKGLKDAFDLQVKANVELIKSLPNNYFNDIQKLVYNNATGAKPIEGGLTNAIMDLTGTTKSKAKLIARDQTAKAVSTYSHMRMQNIGIQGYKWKSSRDIRTAGNPNGLYPNVDDKSKFHGDHWDRNNKYYLFVKSNNPPKAPDGKQYRNPPPDGSPGMAINCRCYADPVIPELED